MSEPVPYSITTRDLCLWYGKFQALKNVNVNIKHGIITSLIGPSGCGKTTLLRCFNRVNERYDYVTTRGEIKLLGKNIYDPDVSLVELRKSVGMVAPLPVGLPLSIYDNVAFAPRTSGMRSRSQLDSLVEKCLRQAALWEEVKDRLDSLGTKLSGGQQQRLTIARALSHQPEVLCLDEFSIAIDPVTTMRIEDVLKELRKEMTIILVTNLVQQARRLANRTLFLWKGEIVELDSNDVIFSDNPKDKRTYEYVNGIFG